MNLLDTVFNGSVVRRRLTTVGLICSGCALFLSPANAQDYKKEDRIPQADYALEIAVEDSARRPLRFYVSKGGRTMGLIPRARLNVKNAEAAGDLTAVDVWADGEEDSIRVRLSIIYNDLSNQEWWKEKKEKILGSYVVREGETIRPAELIPFGIEPFEMRAISAAPVAFAPGEGPKINNNTKSLEVVRIEKSLSHYSFLLKNTSEKNVVLYSAFHGNRGTSVSTIGSSIGSLISPGGTRWAEYHSYDGNEIETLVIKVVVFEDGSFEGDAKLAAGFIAEGEGVKIQAPSIVRMLSRAVESDDAELESTVYKLEAELWKIPEAIEKSAALEILRIRFNSFDEPTIAHLYERLKSGLYSARNQALSQLGNVKRSLETQSASTDSPDGKVKWIRAILERLREDFERIIGK